MKKWIIVLLAGCLLLIPLLIGAFLLAGGTVLAPSLTTISCTGVPGKLPASVPQPLNSIVTQAAAEWDTDPIALAVLFYNENGWSFDRKPPPPYGNGAPWPRSSAGAMGPMQFLPGTYFGYRNANPANQPGNPLDLTDAVYAAAQFLSDIGGKAGTPLGSPADPYKKPSILNALASYHSGPAFTSLGPNGRQYVSRGYKAYVALQTAGGLDGSTQVPNTCVLPDSSSGGDRFADTSALSCVAGTDIGTVQTAKGNNIRLCKVRSAVVNASIAANIEAFFAQADQIPGLNLQSGSSFRSPDAQIAVRRNNCGPSYYDIFVKPSGECSPRTAIPGESEHEQGRALDLTSNGLLITSYSSFAHQQVASIAPRYGLLPLSTRDEAWHFSISGG